ncbi:hypothetical protein, partial [Streptomyces sp. YIM 98790]|uniref:hypothetical protein n=1 Tax=Streptomyces sp. YIM 98790 TaxID=2689077 RepID=UPI0014090274
MRNTDPFAWFTEHRDTIFRWCGITGVLLVLFLLLSRQVRRHGGWRVAGARLRRETAVTALAFTAPLRAWLRYRRSLRLLTALLGDPALWRDCERALLTVRDAAGPAARPYAVLADAATVWVLLAGPAGGPAALRPPEPWFEEPGDPGVWGIGRAGLPAVAPAAGGPCPVLVALGEQDRACAFLDLAAGPRITAVDGDEHNRRMLTQALAAQLDARLPRGLVTVAAGVHPRYPGMPLRDAYRAARAAAAAAADGSRSGTGTGTGESAGALPAVLAAPELPDPLPPELAAPPGRAAAPRVLVTGRGRGHVRYVPVDRYGRAAVAGTPLLTEAAALGRAVARTLRRFP